MKENFHFDDVYDVLDQAIKRVQGFNSELADYYIEFKRCIEQFDRHRDRAALDCFRDQYLTVLDKTEPYFEDKSISEVLVVIVQAHYICKAIYADDPYGFKTHMHILAEQKALLA